MEITSPNSLWKEYDVAALPLNISYLSEKCEDGACVKELYFDGYTTVDGRTRVFIKILENPEAKGVILYLPDVNGGGTDPLIKSLYDSGYTVAALDYLGATERTAHYTLYPKSLSQCNCRGLNEFTATDDTKAGPWYIWTCISRRAIKLLREKYEKNIFAVGVGLGGSTVYKLSVFDDGLIACATLLNIIPNVKGEGNALINYHASLDNSAYAPFCRVPFFMAVSSNDEDGSLDDMSELAENTNSLSLFRIVERAFSGGIKAVYGDVDKFFTAHAINAANFDFPEITASNSEGSLYFNINANEQALSTTAPPKLYVSFCIEEIPYRNWMNIPIISLGGGKFMSHINVCQNNKPINAFINTQNDDGITQSSALLSIMPKTLGVKARDGIAHRKIYDGSMGKDGWTSRDGGTVSLVKGPYDIDGVTCDTKSILTFKPGDPLFKVSADTLLQIMISGEPQLVCVTVSDKEHSYSSRVEIKNSDDWHKFSLAHINFKGDFGPLPDWSRIMTLEFYAEQKLVIGSVLWV